MTGTGRIRRTGALALALVVGTAAVALTPTAGGADVETGRMTLSPAPGDIAVDPDDGRVYAYQQYVPDPPGVRSAFVTIEGDEVVDDLTLPYAAVAMAVDTARDRAYVVTSQYPAYSLHAIDLASSSIVQTISLPSQALRLDVDEVSGRLAITLISPHRVQVYDGPTLSIVADVSVSQQPQWVAISDGGAEVFVSTGGTSSLALSGPSYATQRTLPGVNGWATEYDDASGTLYVASYGQGVLKIDAATGTLLDTLPPAIWGNAGAPTDMALDDGGQRLLLRNRDHQLSVVDTSTMEEVGVIGGLLGVTAIDVDESADRVVVSDQGGAIVDLAPTSAPDPLPTVVALDAFVEEGDPVPDPHHPWETGEYAEHTVQVVLDEASSEWVRAEVAFTANTAAFGDDFASNVATAYIAPGEQTGDVRFVTRADEVAEDVETLGFAVTSALGAVADTTSTTITIVDDDDGGASDPVISLLPDPSAGEGDDELTFFAELDVPSATDVTVTWSTADDTAMAGDDYDGTGGELLFPAGETLVPQAIPVVDDADEESDETFTISLSDPVGATTNGIDATATIHDDDTPPVTITAPADRSVVEGGTGTTTLAPVTLLFDRPAPSAAELTWALTPLTATAGADYTAGGGTAAIAAGDTSVTLPVEIRGDALDELNERVAVDLVDVSGNAVLGADTRTVVTITDDDAAPTLAIGDVSASEGDPLSFTVSLSAPSSRPVSVSYTTTRSTTVAADHPTVSGTAAIPAGSTTATITVATTEDVIDELDEAFFVNLSGAVNATIADNRATGTIVDEDTSAVTVSPVVATGVLEGHSGTRTAAFNVRLSNPSSRTVAVTLQTFNGTARSTNPQADYQALTTTVTFSPGQTAKVVNVTILGDRRVEPDETYVLRVTAVTGGATGVGVEGNGIIRTDD